VSIIYINPYQFATAGVTYDTDAQAFITLVEAADGQALETGVRDAINAFVVGCKADGIWAAIKACCIMAGARTLAGALVPLVGAAPPTNFNFVSGDYDRKTGLVGNGSTKYLNSNYQFPNLATARNNNHAAYYRAPGDLGTFHAGAALDVNAVFFTINHVASRNFEGVTGNLIAADSGAGTGFRGIARSNSASYIYRNSAANTTGTITSLSATNNRGLAVFARNNAGTIDAFATSRISFYSIGESLDLALLDARVTTLINAFAAAIP
jgi:hypothetical protein